MPNVPRSSAHSVPFLVKEGGPLIACVMQCLSGVSRTKAKGIIAGGGVQVEHQVVTRANHPVLAGQLVEINTRPSGAQRSKFNYNDYFTVVWEDDDVIVVDKRDEVLSMGVGHGSLNMKDLLDRYFADTHQRCRAHVVHRLDVRTSGLMMYAKSVEVQQLLTADWRSTIIDRRYVAVVEGEMPREQGHVESWLKDTDSMRVLSYRDQRPGTKWASTDWRLLQGTPAFSLVELHLHTGRKNQIRVHMQQLRHPIVGDRKYGSVTPNAKRLCLHAFRLAFHHPRTGEPLHFETPFPSYFLSFFQPQRPRSRQ